MLSVGELMVRHHAERSVWNVAERYGATIETARTYFESCALREYRVYVDAGTCPDGYEEAWMDSWRNGNRRRN